MRFDKNCTCPEHIQETNEPCPKCPITWGEWKNLGPTKSCNHALMIREEICQEREYCSCRYFEGGKKEGKCGNNATMTS
jgi:hypothetical protein